MSRSWLAEPEPEPEPEINRPRVTQYSGQQSMVAISKVVTLHKDPGFVTLLLQ